MVVDRLKNGESFTNLAKELSIDKLVVNEEEI